MNNVAIFRALLPCSCWRCGLAGYFCIASKPLKACNSAGLAISTQGARPINATDQRDLDEAFGRVIGLLFQCDGATGIGPELLSISV